MLLQSNTLVELHRCCTFYGTMLQCCHNKSVRSFVAVHKYGECMPVARCESTVLSITACLAFITVHTVDLVVLAGQQLLYDASPLYHVQ
jgi:hypothetical protein